MLMKSRVFLSCAALCGGIFCGAAQAAVEVIRPEDEALLEGIFTQEEGDTLNARNSRSVAPKSGLEDGSGTLMRGVRPANRVTAEPRVADVEKRKSTAAKGGGKAVKVAAGAAKNGAGTNKTAQQGDGAEMTVTAGGGTLKGAMTTVVEGAEVRGAEAVAVKSDMAVPAAEKKAAAVLPAEKGGDKAVKATVASGAEKIKIKSGYATRGGEEEIIYVYPSKGEREVARQPLDEWYNPALHEHAGVANGGENGNDTAAREAEEAGLENHRAAIAGCLDTRAAGLDLERAMLRQGNVYDAAAYLSQTFEEINACYEERGFDIINDYYGGDPSVSAAFVNKARQFYVGGADLTLDPKFCGEDCSLEAIVDAQVDKFAEFRTYLAELLAERPSGN